MSAIFGVAHLDGEPVPAESLRAMDAALAGWGADGGGAWRQGPCGLGQRLLYNTPESLHERMPLTSRDGKVVLVAAARLDDREGLFGALGVPHAERAAMPDGELILRAYERWGEETPSRLLGDWAFAAWDRERRRLLLARDQYGHTALYYHANPRFFAFASGHEALFRLPRVPRRLNELHVAELFFGWPGDGTATLWEDVRRLPPGHSLTASERGVAVREYWRAHDAPEVRLGSDEAYVERFLELYGQAVRCRVRSHRPVGSTLSAGLDSSSVTALAARELRAQGRPLVAFTSAPREAAPDRGGATPLVDEWPLAAAAAGYIGVAEHLKVSGERVSPLGALERTLAIHSEPAPAALGHYWVHDMLSAARQRGLGTLLLGQRGNGTVSWNGGSFALPHLAVTGAWGTVRRELAGESRATGVPVARVAWRRLLWPVIDAARAQLRWRFRDPRTVWARHTPLEPGFMERSGVVRHMRRTEHRAGWYSARTPRAEQLATLMPGLSAAGAFLHELGAGYGMELRDPTADLRLLEFCLGIPRDQFIRNGQSRWLIRRGMEGLLPREVQWNTRRGLQSGDMTRLALGELGRIGEVVARVESSPLAARCLSMPLLRRLWEDLQRPETAEAEGPAYYLFGMLSVGLFLVREEDAARPR
ncbi:MAG TPA: asparagine synthase-related protein [Longimicrobium sp.]|nr:asparagine synthase-related protein [Longimicrobium sp.]